VENKTGHQCVWACLETLAKHNNVKALQGLTDDHLGNAYPIEVDIVLLNSGAKFKHQMPGRKDTEILDRADQSGRGAMVVIHMNNGTTHAITFVGWDDKWVRYINSGKDRRVHRFSRRRFMEVWNGQAITLHPRK
jgi:hypothetical protein